jgi:protocatechuate 3,4-dioxygenase beta subunit
MKIHAIALLVFVLHESATSIPQQSNPEGSIEGRVVRSGSGEPIPEARITVEGRGQKKTTTSQSGQFVISDLDAPGRYRIEAVADGYARQEYGQNPVYVAAGQTLKGIDFELVPAGYVTGRIRDDTGKPINALAVHLLQATYKYAAGQRSFHDAGSTVTNERGDYRLSSVTRGRYYLVAGSVSQLRSTSVSGARTNNIRKYALTYYPGVIDLPDAVVIDVSSGHDLSAIDFTVYPQKTYRVHGRIIDSRTGQPPHAVFIQLQSHTFPREIMSSLPEAGYDAATGKFEVHDVQPGSYMLMLEVRPDKNESTSLPVSRVSVDIVVADSDIDGLVLTAFPPASIPGRLTIDGREVTSVQSFERIRVGLEGSQAYALSGKINPDGTFSIDGVTPGKYQVGVCMGLQSNPGGCARETPDFYLKYAQFDRRDALNSPLEFGGIPSQLDIVLSSKPSRIQGTVVNESQSAVAGVRAVLVPDHNRDRFDLYKVAASDSGGHFAMRGITPGAYKIFAFEALEENAYLDPDFMQRFEPYGKAVRVEEGDQLNIDVKVIPANK